MNTEEELQKKYDSLYEDFIKKEEEIEELEDEIKDKERESYKFECERDDLQEKLNDIEERKDDALRLLTNLYLSKPYQTEWDAEINDLLVSVPDLLPRYVTPYFLKPSI